MRPCHTRVNSQDVGVHESNACAILRIGELAVADGALALWNFNKIDVNRRSVRHDEWRRWSGS